MSENQPIPEKEDILKTILPIVDSGGFLEKEHIDQLKELFLEDRVVSKDEAELLFYIKNKTEDSENMELMHPGPEKIPGFKDLFVQALTSYILFTGNTPGSLDTIEFIWLSDHIDEDYNFDYMERELLINIALKAETLPPNFYTLADQFEEKVVKQASLHSEDVSEHHKNFLSRLKSLLK
jgi:hypothetical protein